MSVALESAALSALTGGQCKPDHAGRGASPGPRRTAPLSGSLWLLLSLALAAGCSPEGRRDLLEGHRLLQAGRPAEAVAPLREAIRIFTTNSIASAHAWNSLGLAYHQSGQLENAALCYKAALDRDPNLFAARYNRGYLYFEQGNHTGAISELTSYTAHRQDDPAGWLMLGKAQLRAGITELAENNLQQVLRLKADPRLQAEALNALGVSQVRRRKAREAFQYFEAALNRVPDYAPTLLNQAVLSHQLNDRGFAYQKYRAYLEVAGNAAQVSAVRNLTNELGRLVAAAARPPETPAASVTRPGPSAVALATQQRTSPPPALAITSPAPALVITSPAPALTRTATSPAPALAITSPAPASVITSPAPALARTATSPAPALAITSPAPALVITSPAPALARTATSPAPALAITSPAPALVTTSPALAVTVPSPPPVATVATRQPELTAPSIPPVTPPAAETPRPDPALLASAAPPPPTTPALSTGRTAAEEGTQPPGLQLTAPPLTTAPVEPEPAVEVVQLPEDLPSEPARDPEPSRTATSLAAEAQASESDSAPTVTTTTPSPDAPAEPEEPRKRSFFARLNPVGWFGSKDADREAEKALAEEAEKALAEEAEKAEKAEKARLAEIEREQKAERARAAELEKAERAARREAERAARTAPRPAPSAEQARPIATPVPVPAVPVVVVSPPPPVFPRYAYGTPATPNPGNRADANRLVTVGVQAHRENRLADAQSAYARAVAADPANFNAQFNLAVVAFDQRDWPLALTSYERALAIAPQDARARYGLGLALERAGYPLDAATEWQRVLARDPAHVESHLALANLYATTLSDNTLARAHYERVLELQPNHPQAGMIRRWLGPLPR